MRPTVRHLALATVVGCVWIGWSARTDHDVMTAQQRTPVVVTRIYTGADGHTHAEEINVKLAGRGSSELSELIKVSGVQFQRSPRNYFIDWHPAARRQYVITLSGRGEIELAGGKTISQGPGHVLLAEDLTGKGHISRGVGAEDRVTLFIPLPDRK